jgi:hypothetical protein
MRWWRQSICFPVIFFIVTTYVDRASAATLVNGANQTGIIFTNTVADSYTFAANTGDKINLRLGTTNFDGWLQLFGPDGKLLVTGTDSGSTDAHIDDYMATNSGTFTVLVSSWFPGDTGTYALHLAQIPEAFIVSGSDQGGAMTGNASYPGTITLGDLDIWAFTACTGDLINLRLNTTNFDGWLELFGQMVGC